ncbi:MAG: hypothetical protein ACOH2N_00125 [Devosia sp.]
MANKTVAELTAGDPPDGTELLHGVQGSNSRKFTLANLLAWWLTDDDTMAAAVATKPASGESVKAYVDSLNTPWVAYTPTFTGFGTVTSISMFSRRNGPNLEVMGKFTTGTVTATEARMSLGFNGTDGNVTSNSTQVPSIRPCGTANVSFIDSSVFVPLIDTTLSYVKFGKQDTGLNGFTPVNGNSFASAGIVGVCLSIPITGW